MHLLTLEELKKLQFDILSNVDSFCKENNLRYSLAYGTLLGAVRHKGFIPWDDDIDIWMPRADYDVFRKKYKHSRYFVVDKFDNIMLPFGKVCDNQTKLIENANYSFSPGVFIDIFPIDNLPSNIRDAQSIKVKIRTLYRLKSIKEIRYNKSRSVVKNILLAILKASIALLSYKSILERISKLMLKAKPYESMYLTDYNDYEKDVRIPLGSFESLIELPFEGKMFSCIANYNDVLTSSYGGYMKLPPVEKRVSHHAYVARFR